MPGSGKTRVLISRIAHLIEERGVPARQILAITFTRKAAGELQTRIAASLGPKAAAEVVAGVCNLHYPATLHIQDVCSPAH